jgi:hypothetical protein
MFKTMAFFIIKVFVRLCLNVGILLTWEKHLHDWIISPRGEIWAQTSSFTPPLVNEVTVTNGWVIDFASFYDLFLMDLKKCSDSV